jgi:hypothetical protein
MAEELMRLADVLETGVRGRAKNHGWSTVANTTALTEQSDLGIDPVLDALAQRATAARKEVLPTFRRAFDLQPAALSLLVCGLDGAQPEHSYRSALWWAGLVRSRTALAARADLHLFLIAPPGTDQEPTWKGRRSRLESDERFCRKFVWLPSAAPTPQEVGAFLDRTFLAEPWTGESASPRSLDPLERAVEEIGSGGLLTAEEALRWIARLGASAESGYQQMAQDLVAILEDQEFPWLRRVPTRAPRATMRHSPERPQRTWKNISF